MEHWCRQCTCVEVGEDIGKRAETDEFWIQKRRVIHTWLAAPQCEKISAFRGRYQWPLAFSIHHSHLGNVTLSLSVEKRERGGWMLWTWQWYWPHVHCLPWVSRSERKNSDCFSQASALLRRWGSRGDSSNSKTTLCFFSFLSISITLLLLFKGIGMAMDIFGIRLQLGICFAWIYWVVFTCLQSFSCSDMKI